MYNPLLVSSLNKCKDENDVENTFSKFHKKDYKTRIKYLDICRGNPVTFFTGNNENESEQNLYSKYLTIRSMFLTGSWR
jgi:hypothetical protein